MSQELVDSVNTLTTQTTAVLNEYVQAKTTMDGKVAQAAASATAATTKAGEAATSEASAAASAQEAENSKLGAKSEADRAKSEADRAAEIAGLNTVGEAVAAALNDRKLTMRTKADMEAMRAQNLERFAASGFVNWGKHVSPSAEYAPINQGMRTSLSSPNALYMGESANAVGLSKTNEPVIHIAGFISRLSMLNTNVREALNQLKFDEPEAGTRVYDSETGQSIDYRYEVDPKYGDVAPTLNEAVSRAWEGPYLKNGDMRFGIDHWISREATLSAAGGVLTVSPNGTGASRAEQSLNEMPAGKYIFEVDVKVPAGGYATVQLYQPGAAGASVYLDDTNPEWQRVTHTIDTTGATGTAWFQLQANNEGCDVQFRNISFRKVSQQVVTQRVDLAGFELFLQRITKNQPYVFKYGAVQSAAPDINGVATEDTTYPDTYHEVFPGDKSSKKGVPLFSKSVIEQDAILNDPDQNIFNLGIDDQGEPIIVQLTVRQKTYRGIGNGDFYNLDTEAKGYNALRFDGGNNKTFITPQGSKDSVDPYCNGSETDGLFIAHGDTGFGGASNRKSIKSRGTYAASAGANVAYNNMCLFLPICTISRLNSGAYHPSFNPAGTRAFCSKDGTSRQPWWNARTPARTTADCFKFAHEGSDYPFDNGIVYGPASSDEGSISASGLIRPDGRAYDACYPDGLGGVDDLRLSAWGTEAEDYSRVKSELLAGTYRGAETLQLTKIYSYVKDGGWVNGDDIWLGEAGTGSIKLKGGIPNELNPPHYVLRDDTKEVIPVSRVFTDHTGATFVGIDKSLGIPNGTQLHYVYRLDTNITVSGKFLITEALGDPAKILQCDALKNGWLGVWNPTIPDDQKDEFDLTREYVGSDNDITRTYTNDDGATWTSGKIVLADVAGNKTVFTDHPTTQVTMYNYNAFAKQVEDCENSPVQDAEAGVGSVFASSFSKKEGGALLGEALLGKVLTQNENVIQYEALPLLRSTLDGVTGKLTNNDLWRSGQEHGELKLGQTSGAAFKALDTRTKVNAQAFLDFHFCELVWDETAQDWGDNGKVPIGDNTGTKTDLNGHSVLFGTKRLVKPIGWIKNNF